MLDFEEDDESLIGLSCSKSIVLTTWTMSKVFSLNEKSVVQKVEDSHDMLEQPLNRKVQSNCPVHVCLNWLSENKSYITSFPADIVSDYVINCHNPTNQVDVKSKRSFLQKTIDLIREKVKSKTRNGNKSEEIKKESEFFLLKLNSNSNKPCCNSNLQKESSDTKKSEKFLQGNFSRTYTQEYEENLSSNEESQDVEQSTDESDTSEVDSERMILGKMSKPTLDLSKMGSPSDDYYPNDSQMPKLVISRARSRTRPRSIDESKLRDRNIMFDLLDSLSKTYGKREYIPKSYNICYKFYLYLYPSQTDASLLLFQRHELNDISKMMDPFDVMQLIEETKADFLFDRRLRMVQNKCHCHIVLEALSQIYINGLPHRLINIYSSSYENIGKALSLMEEAMPEIMRTCVFKESLPLSYSTKWSSENMIIRPINRGARGALNSVSWFNRLNPDMRYSSFNYLLNDRNKDSSIKSGERLCQKSSKSSEDNVEYITPENVESSAPLTNIKINISVSTTQSQHLNLSNIFYEVVAEDLATPKLKNDTKTSAMNVTSKFLSNNSLNYHHLKRIKCPSLILKKGIFSDICALNFLFDKFHCNITRVDVLDTVENGTCPMEEQVKLTIVYNSREELHEFCRALGLCIKVK